MRFSKSGCRESVKSLPVWCTLDTDLIHFVEPVLVGGQLSHEGLVFEPLAVKVPGLIIRRILSCQHLLIDPHSQLYSR